MSALNRSWLPTSDFSISHREGGTFEKKETLDTHFFHNLNGKKYVHKQRQGQCPKIVEIVPNTNSFGHTEVVVEAYKLFGAINGESRNGTSIFVDPKKQPKKFHCTTVVEQLSPSDVTYNQFNMILDRITREEMLMLIEMKYKMENDFEKGETFWLEGTKGGNLILKFLQEFILAHK